MGPGLYHRNSTAPQQNLPVSGPSASGPADIGAPATYQDHNRPRRQDDGSFPYRQIFPKRSGRPIQPEMNPFSPRHDLPVASDGQNGEPRSISRDLNRG